MRAGLASYLKDSPERRPLVAALSGGADSTALVAALASLSLIEVHAFHVNHGIRPPESCSADENAARSLCEKLNIPFNAEHIPPGAIEDYAKRRGTGIEAAARKFRYDALWQEARRLGAGAVATAHTAGDRLETILMAFLRGAGPAGLGALSEFSGAAFRDGISHNDAVFQYKDGPGAEPILVRPMLALGRAEVIAYLNERGLSYCTDESNDDERYLRNKVRRILVPVLDEHFSQWRGTAIRLGETQAMTAAFLAEEAEKRLPWEDHPLHPESPALPADYSDCSAGHYDLSAERFFAEPEILREEALFRAVDALAGDVARNPRREVLREFARGSRNAADMGNVRLENKNGRVTARKAKTSSVKSGFSVLIKKAGVYKLNAITVVADAAVAKNAQTGSAAEAVPDKPDFFAAFPVALYSQDGKTIVAEDRGGRAALIREDKRGWKRETSASGHGAGFTLFFNGGSR